MMIKQIKQLYKYIYRKWIYEIPMTYFEKCALIVSSLVSVMKGVKALFIGGNYCKLS